MKKFRMVGLLVLLAVFVLNGLTQTDLQQEIYRARDNVLPALVHVEPIKTIYTTGEKQHTMVTGSGVIFSEEGYVLTNHHVAADAEKVWCTLSNKERITARVIGSDASTDIAVLKLNLEELKDKQIHFARLGNSDSLQVGQLVLALGSPLGLSRSVSMGVISSIDRYFPDQGSMISPYNLWIQTDAAINPGNSGGPLINLRGEVIGINARGVFLAENLGFAIPINLAREVAEKLIKGSTIKRAWIGAEFQPIKDFREYLGRDDFRGVLVAHVDDHSPAQSAGLQPGDVIQEINGTAVHAEFEEDLPTIRKIISDLPIGEQVNLKIWRNGQTKQITLTTVEDPLQEQPEFEAEDWGLVVKNLSWQIYRIQMLPDWNGVYVTAVKSGGPSDKAGLRSGDVIRKINQQPVRNRDQFIEIYQNLKRESTEPVFLELIRDGTPYFAVIQLKAMP